MLFNIFILLLVLLNIFCVYIFFIEPYNLETTYISYPLPTDKTAYQGLKIVHLSDLHLNGFGMYEQKVIKKTNAEEADFICITGDFIMYNQDFAPVMRFLNSLECKKNIYIVFGNSDYSNMHTFFTALKKEPLKTNIYILRNDISNEAYKDQPLLFAGLDDPISGYAKNEAMPYFNTLPGFKILLAHAYTESVKSITYGDDLVLAGHTHGGQINIIPKRIIRRWRNMSDKNLLHFFEGFNKDENAWVNISRGIGMSYLPIRLLARPQICVITLQTVEEINQL